ncbi:MAG: T9SS type A sorting domain-containing protein [Bacteroidetes bacterium]|nr:T9SS type A sorting domain-containing protein [Bacteroidota bacterium]
MIFRGLMILVTMLNVFRVNAQTASSPIVYSGKLNVTIDGKKFTSGTSGAAITLTNCSNVVISNCEFFLTGSIIGVKLSNCSNVEITACYFENFQSGVYALNCTGGLNIHCNSFKNVAGAKPRGQVVQFNTCSGAGNRVNYNTLDHTFGSGTPEDLINMYASYGTTSDPIQIIGNQLRGGGPSTSGGGIMLGDNGSHDIRCEDNILVDVGQYGISAPSGSNITIINNKVYGAKQTWTNVGIYVGLQSEITAGFACTGSSIQVKNNQVNFTNKNGVSNGWYNCSCCAVSNQSGNNFKSSITSSILPTNIILNTSYCGSIATSLVESKSIDGFTVYPNPVSHQLIVSNAGKIESVLLFNSIGQTMAFSEFSVENTQMQIDMSQYPSGIYFIQINNQMKKFVKQ